MDQPKMLVVSGYRRPVSGGHGSNPNIVRRKGRAGLAECNHDSCVNANCLIVCVECIESLHRRQLNWRPYPKWGHRQPLSPVLRRKLAHNAQLRTKGWQPA